VTQVEERPGRLAALTAFATLGALTTAQHLASTLVDSMTGSDPELVAEECMALVSVVTARSLRDDPSVAAAIGRLTLSYRDYVVGAQMLMGDAEAVMETETGTFERIGRKLSFYEAHFPSGKLPGPLALKDKMELWMGRVSPPGLPESPVRRLEKLGLVEVVDTHLKLVRTFAAQ
jgi:hypothetical protein